MTDAPGQTDPTAEGRSRDTQAVWAGEEAYLVERATQVPVVYSAAYGYPDVDAWLEVATGKAPGHIYSRNTNPTTHAFEEKVRVLEGGEAATSFATGMAAISNSLFALLSPGDRVVSVKDTYGGTNQMFVDFLPHIGVSVELVDTGDHEQIEAAVARGCDLLYLETPTNPTLKVLDIARLAAAGHEAGAVVLADNTFATPINQNPLALGVDLVIHSATKFLGGHADALGGVVTGDAAPGRQGVPLPRDHRRLARPDGRLPAAARHEDPGLRIARQNESALRIARWLEGRPEVVKVNYPGLESHPGHDDRRPSDARLRRRAQLHAGRRLRGGAARAAQAAPGPPRRQPRRRGDGRRPAGHHQPRRVQPGGARGHGHPRGPDPLLGGHRGRRRPDRRPGAGAGRPLTPKPPDPAPGLEARRDGSTIGRQRVWQAESILGGGREGRGGGSTMARFWAAAVRPAQRGASGGPRGRLFRCTAAATLFLLLLLAVSAADAAARAAREAIDPAHAPSSVAAPLSTPYKADRLDSALAELAAVSRAGGRTAGARFAAARDLDLERDGVEVLIVARDARPGSSALVRRAVASCGGEVLASYRELVSARIPVGRLAGLAVAPGVLSVQVPERAEPDVVSEGVVDMATDVWVAAGLDGAGVKVGIVDSGFKGYQGLLGSELPSAVTVWGRSSGGVEGVGDGDTHGSSVAEVIHDVAPGAELYLARPESTAELGLAVDWMRAQGVAVINQSVSRWGYGNSGTGPVNDIIDDAVAGDVFWANSAGNYRLAHWMGDFSDPDGDAWLDWDGTPGHDVNTFIVRQGSEIKGRLWWDDSWTAASQDYDLVLLQWSGSAGRRSPRRPTSRRGSRVSGRSRASTWRPLPRGRTTPGRCIARRRRAPTWTST